MAAPLPFEPVASTAPTPQDDLDRLLEALHHSGTLRVLAGLFGQCGAVSEVAIEQVDAPGGRRALGTLTVLARTLTEVDPDGLAALLEATVDGAGAAAETARDEPPSLVGLMGRLRDDDVRRGLNAMLTFLGALGRSLEKG